LKIYINESVRSLRNTYYFRNFLPDCFQNFAFCCILIDGSDYYYYADVTPLKAKNMLLHHETLKFATFSFVITMLMNNCSNCNNVGQLDGCSIFL